MSMIKALTIGAASIAMSAVVAAAPESVSAATVSGDLEVDQVYSVNIANSPFEFSGAVTGIAAGASGSFSRVFTVDPLGFGDAGASVTLQDFTKFEHVTVSWANGTSVSISDANPTELAMTTFSAGQLTDTLTISWLRAVGTTGNTSFNYSGTVSAIPLPAAGWLLLGGIGALGSIAAARRRREASAV